MMLLNYSNLIILLMAIHQTKIQDFFAILKFSLLYDNLLVD